MLDYLAYALSRCGLCHRDFPQWRAGTPRMRRSLSLKVGRSRAGRACGEPRRRSSAMASGLGTVRAASRARQRFSEWQELAALWRARANAGPAGSVGSPSRGETAMNRIFAFAAPGHAAEIPVANHRRLKERAAGKKVALTFAERRVLVLGIGRRHAARHGHRTVAND
jgi:hypothetical protein